MSLSVEEVIEALRSMGDRENVEGMARYGITSRCEILGVPKPKLRELARAIGRNHGGLPKGCGRRASTRRGFSRR